MKVVKVATMISCFWLSLLAGCAEQGKTSVLPAEADEGAMAIARDRLKECCPPGFRAWANNVFEEVNRSLDGPAVNVARSVTVLRKETKDFFREEADYTTLLRIVGCVSMRWNALFFPEQAVALWCLSCAPARELETAVLESAVSLDEAVRRGACRLVFAGGSWPLSGKRREDWHVWMCILARQAYLDPWKENRRLVLWRLSTEGAIKTTSVRDVAIEAARDPDQTVRRRAFRVLAMFDGDLKVKALLGEIASGNFQPRTAPPENPTDYSVGAALSVTAGMEEEIFRDTDSAAARKILKKMEGEEK